LSDADATQPPDHDPNQTEPFGDSDVSLNLTSMNNSPSSATSSEQPENDLESALEANAPQPESLVAPPETDLDMFAALIGFSPAEQVTSMSAEAIHDSEENDSEENDSEETATSSDNNADLLIETKPLEPEIASSESRFKTQAEPSENIAVPQLTATMPVEDMTNQPTETLPETTSKTAPPLQSPAEFQNQPFQQTFVQRLQKRGKSPSTATQQDCYAVLAEIVHQQLNPLNLENVLQSRSRVRVAIARHFGLGTPLETHLVNLGSFAQVEQDLQPLGLDLRQILQQEGRQRDNDLGCVTGSLLDAWSSANFPAMGYGLCSNIDMAEPTVWQQSSDAKPIEVKFGGYTETYVDAEGRYCSRWVPEQVVLAVASDRFISGYGRNQSNRLRCWRLSQPLQADVDPEELDLKQSYVLAACTVQDVIRLHLGSGATIDTLDQRFSLQLHDAPLVIAELMRQLVDQYGMTWERSWSIVQNAAATVFHQLVPARSGEWRLELFCQVLPRHIEIINEINRRFLEEVRQRYPNDEARVGPMSLVPAGHLRFNHLAVVGSGSITGLTPLHTQLIQHAILPDLSMMSAPKFQPRTFGIAPRRFLLQANPSLAEVITQGIGASWIAEPEQLQQLEALVNDDGFCGNWWQVKRSNKQALAAYIQQKTEATVSLNSLFDVQSMPVEPGRRQLLHLLHVITLYVRLKSNSTTDTIVRFAHRSVPRTAIFVGTAPPHLTGAAAALSQAVTQLIQAVANAVNDDPDVQGRLQVIFLEEDAEQTLRLVLSAADLAEQIPLADHEPPSVIPFQFGLNGALTIGTPDSTNLELRQAIGAKNLFLFGMTASEVESLRSKGYDPQPIYNSNPELKQAINLIATGYFTYGDQDTFRPLAEWLVYQDPYLILADYTAYMHCQERVSQAFQDQKAWTWMSILTTAHMKQFCSDQNIR
jgi:starch phosphorylase